MLHCKLFAWFFCLWIAFGQSLLAHTRTDSNFSSDALLLVDGRALGPKGLLAGGEILQAPPNQRITLRLDKVGLLTLSHGATVQVGIAASATSAVQYSFGASVISGHIEVALRPEVNAYVNVMGATFMAAPGAKFRLGVAEENLTPAVVSLGHYRINVPADLFTVERAPTTTLSAEKILRAVRSTTLSPVNTAKPIGTIESAYSAGLTGLDAISKLNFGLLWGGELIQAPAHGSTRARLVNVGQVTLAQDSQARLNSVTPVTANGPHQRALIASLFSGEMTVKLDASAGAYVQAVDNNFIAPNGSSFRLIRRQGQTLTEALPGAVEAIGSYHIEAPLPVLDAALRSQQTPITASTRRYKIRPVGFDYSMTVATRSTRQIQVQVTDENDRPVPDVPVIWGLRAARGQSVGTLPNDQQYRSVTNAQGIATAPFEAGQVPGSDFFTATIEGTNFTMNGTINVVRAAGGFWNVPTATPVIATVVAAAVVAGVVIKKNADEPQPLAPAIPIIIRP
jgi:hypothetical protein